jgi:hypothetical protein
LATFPRSSERGPIEACGTATANIAGWRFPRSSERGPIEACRSSRRSPTVAHFRTHLSAAPLKLGSQVGTVCQLDVFPRLSERGPIEAPYCGTGRSGRLAYFRVHLNAAPLKARTLPQEQPAARIISAAKSMLSWNAISRAGEGLPSSADSFRHAKGHRHRVRFPTLWCGAQAKLGQTLCTSLPKKSAAWQSFASGRIWVR